MKFLGKSLILLALLGAGTVLAQSRTIASAPAGTAGWVRVAVLSLHPDHTTAMLPSSVTCGWALHSVGAPWVAHLVWAMPV